MTSDIAADSFADIDGNHLGRAPTDSMHILGPTALAAQIARLPHIEQLVLALRHSEGLHPGEIAVVLGFPAEQIARVYKHAIATIEDLKCTGARDSRLS